MARKPYDPPFSLRLSFEERARLAEQAEGMPLGGAHFREHVIVKVAAHRDQTIFDFLGNGRSFAIEFKLEEP